MKIKQHSINITIISVFMLLGNIVDATEHELGHSVLERPFNNNVIDYGQVIYGTFIVFIILGVLVFLLKKSGVRNYGKNELIEVINSHALSNKEKILVIRVGEEYLLVGVSSGGINKLHTLNTNDAEKYLNINSAQINKFSNIYSATLGRLRNA